ncbi:sodium:proton antiporter [Pseudoroseomonas sp. WGS1072]|uniref:sodium:proton antiporter n=1 Tax=Roseomonas sp. WGS1072 TaxID=3366816 RepID=UPI003BEF7E5A
MILLLSAAIALLAACGVFLMLSRNLVRLVLGISLLSTAVNLLIFAMGRIGTTVPPLIPPGAQSLAPAAANPLPQALVLTAIVIGFALVAFLAALVLRLYGRFGTLDSREIDAAERLGDPFLEPPRPEAPKPESPRPAPGTPPAEAARHA